MLERHPVLVQRIYDRGEATSGARVLVDRLWPRGVSHEKADLDAWCRDVAPSPELRTWYRHQDALFDEFRARYLAELTGGVQAAALEVLRGYHASGPLILLTASKAVEISNAAVLAELLRDRAAEN